MQQILSNIRTGAVFLRNHPNNRYLIEITKVYDNGKAVDIVEYTEVRHKGICVVIELFADWYKDSAYLGDNLKLAQLLYIDNVGDTNENTMWRYSDYSELYRKSCGKGSSY